MHAATRPVNPLVRAWKRYLTLLETRPLITKSISAFVIGGVGDIIAQSIDPPHAPVQSHLEKSSDLLTAPDPKPKLPGFVWDKDRTLRLSLYGLVFAAPITHGWYKILDSRLGKGMDIATALKKVAVDQTVMAAPMTALFFGVNSAMEGCNREEIENRLRQNLWPTLKANWAIWPLALTVNFWFVPLKLRVLVVNILGLGWGTYLSFVQHKQHEHLDTHLPDPYPPDTLPVGYPPGPVKEG
ncbi:hypothetical protein HK104_000819 [Borealophlyctis nickersoniae]|nr:hypothetical protein HK104_000819 [Borealophlyctis nickersoniae]